MAQFLVGGLPQNEIDLRKSVDARNSSWIVKSFKKLRHSA